MSKRSRCRLPRITDISSCIDLALDSPVKCKSCIGKSDLVLGRKNKRDKNKKVHKCEQPWSIDKYKSRWSRAKSTFFRAWDQLVALGYTAPSVYAAGRIVQEADEPQCKKPRTVEMMVATTTLPLEVATTMNMDEQVPSENPTDDVQVGQEQEHDAPTLPSESTTASTADNADDVVEQVHGEEET